MSTSSQADVYQIVYISGATQPIADRDLRVLANSFAQRNKQLHVTGLLLYHNKRFMQFLEGDIMIVGGLFEKIRNDPRHHSVFVMRRQYVLNRQFPDWTMRLAAPDEIRVVGGAFGRRSA